MNKSGYYGVFKAFGEEIEFFCQAKTLMCSCFSTLITLCTKLSIFDSWETIITWFMFNCPRTSLTLSSCSVLNPSVGSSRIMISFVFIPTIISFMTLIGASIVFGLMIHNIDLTFNMNLITNDMQKYQAENNLSLVNFRDVKDDTSHGIMNMIEVYKRSIINLPFIFLIGIASALIFQNSLDYFLLFNSSIELNKNNYNFNTKEAIKAYDFYYNFNDKYNQDKDFVKKYLEKFSNIDRNLYLKEDIISFDFCPVSNALFYDKSLLSIILIKDLKYASLKQKVIALNKDSLIKKEAGLFISYLLKYETQKYLFERSFNNPKYYSTRHIPIYPGITGTSGFMPDNLLNLDKYINNLSSFNFHNEKIRKKFLKAYENSIQMLNNGALKESNYLDFISNELNK